VWLVDGNVELVHFASSSRVGSVESRPDTNTSSRYTSSVLSLRNTGNEICMDVVLIATQTQPDWRPDVRCRSSNEQHVIEYGVSMTAPLPEIHNRSVTLRHSIDEYDIVSVGNNYTTTQILVCRSSSGRASWLRQRSFLTTFNGGNTPGNSVYVSMDSSTVLWGSKLPLLYSTQIEMK